MDDDVTLLYEKPSSVARATDDSFEQKEENSLLVTSTNDFGVSSRYEDDDDNNNNSPFRKPLNEETTYPESFATLPSEEANDFSTLPSAKSGEQQSVIEANIRAAHDILDDFNGQDLLIDDGFHDFSRQNPPEQVRSGGKAPAADVDLLSGGLLSQEATPASPANSTPLAMPSAADGLLADGLLGQGSDPGLPANTTPLAHASFGMEEFYGRGAEHGNGGGVEQQKEEKTRPAPPQDAYEVDAYQSIFLNTEEEEEEDDANETAALRTSEVTNTSAPAARGSYSDDASYSEAGGRISTVQTLSSTDMSVFSRDSLREGVPSPRPPPTSPPAPVLIDFPSPSLSDFGRIESEFRPALTPDTALDLDDPAESLGPVVTRKELGGTSGRLDIDLYDKGPSRIRRKVTYRPNQDQREPTAGGAGRSASAPTTPAVGYEAPGLGVGFAQDDNEEDGFLGGEIGVAHRQGRDERPAASTTESKDEAEAEEEAQYEMTFEPGLVPDSPDPVSDPLEYLHPGNRVASIRKYGPGESPSMPRLRPPRSDSLLDQIGDRIGELAHKPSSPRLDADLDLRSGPGPGPEPEPDREPGSDPGQRFETTFETDLSPDIAEHITDGELAQKPETRVATIRRYAPGESPPPPRGPPEETSVADRIGELKTRAAKPKAERYEITFETDDQPEVAQAAHPARANHAGQRVATIRKFGPGQSPPTPGKLQPKSSNGPRVGELKRKPASYTGEAQSRHEVLARQSPREVINMIDEAIDEPPDLQDDLDPGFILRVKDAATGKTYLVSALTGGLVAESEEEYEKLQQRQSVDSSDRGESGFF